MLTDEQQVQKRRSELLKIYEPKEAIEATIRENIRLQQQNSEKDREIEFLRVKIETLENTLQHYRGYQ